MSELSQTKPIKFSDIKKSLSTLPNTYLLDNLPTNIKNSTSLACSLRRLVKNYIDPVVRVRRDSDNAHEDFYSDESSNLTNSAGVSYIDWLGTARGYLTKWYDQSGTKKDISQGMYRFQPEVATTRAYPPVALTANTTILSGNRYGNGSYVVSASSSLTDAGQDIFRAFDKVLTGNNYWLSSNSIQNLYNNTTGLYEGNSTIGGVNGEWLKIQLPAPIILKSYNISPPLDSTENRTAKEYRILGSNDDSNWTIVDDRTGTNALADWLNTTPRTFSTSNTKSYLYYAIVITVNGNSSATSKGATAIMEWTLNALSDAEIIYDGSVDTLDTQETFSYPPAPLNSDNQTVIMAFPPSMSSESDMIDSQTYIASASSSLVNETPIHGIFNESVNSYWHSTNTYNDTTGAYIGAVTTTATNGTTYSGEWVQIQLPTAIRLHTYTLMSRERAPHRSPSSFAILGSNDGTNWALVDDRTGVTSWANRTQLTFTPNSGTSYSYFRLVSRINGNTGSDRSVVTIAQWRLFTNSIASLSPPSAMTANTTTISGETYITSASSEHSSTYQAFRAVDNSTTSNGTYWLSSNDTYNAATGRYIGTNKLGDVSGEWLKVQLPRPVLLNSYTITPRTHELRYPPTALTAASTTLSGQPYGNGTYVISQSQSYDSNEVGWKAFDSTTTGSWWSTGFSYSSTDGSFPGTTSTTIDGQTYLGHWIQIQMPQSILLTRYELFPRADFRSTANTFWVAGSNDGSTWTMVDSQSNITGYDYSGKAFTVNTQNLSPQTGFRYYRMIINKTNVERVMSISDFKIFGIEMIQGRNIKEYKLLGSNDDINWSTVDDKTNISALPNWGTETYSKTFQVRNVLQTFRYFALVATTVGDSTETYGRTAVALPQLQLITTPIINSHKTSGVYSVSASSNYLVNSFPTYQTVDGILTGGNFWHSEGSWNTTTGLYTGSVSTIAQNKTYLGEWLQIKLPNAINIGSFTITPRQDSNNWLTRSPRSFVLLGSRDGSTWNLVDEETNVNDWTSSTKTFTVNASGNNFYDHYRLVVRRVGNSDSGSGQGTVQITEMKLIESVIPLAPGDDTYTYVADWTPFNMSDGGIIDSNTLVGTNNRRSGFIRFGGGVYGFNGQFNDANEFVPYVANVSKKSVMICDHTQSGINIRVVDNGVVYNGTTSSPSLLNLGAEYFTIGRATSFAAYHNGIINEIIIIRDPVPLDASLMYTSGYVTSKANLPEPVPDLWLDFHPKDTTALHNNFGLYTDAACDISMLQTLTNNTAVASWNGYTQSTPSNRPVYFNSGGYTNDHGFVRFNRANSQHLTGGSKTLNIATNGGFTAISIVRFTGTPGEWERIFDFGSGTPNNNVIFVRYPTLTSISFILRNGTTLAGEITASNAIIQDEWAVFACRYNSQTNIMEIFKNGIVIASGTATVGVTDRTVTNSYIGRSAWAADAYLSGDISGLYVVDKFLTDTEMSAVTAQMAYPLLPARLPNPNTGLVKPIGNIVYQQHRNGFAAKFDGTANSFIDIQHVPALPISFSFWFNIQSTAYQTIIGLTDMTRLNGGIQLEYNLGGVTNALTIAVVVNNVFTNATVSNILTNTWYHLVIRVQSNCQVNVYLNGSTTATTVNASNITTNSLPRRSRLIVGSSGDISRGFNGLLYDFRLYYRLLNVSEVPLIHDYSSSFMNSNVQDTSQYLVNARTYSTEMRVVQQLGTYAAVFSGSRQRQQLQLTSNSVTNSCNVLGHPFRIQDYESFTCSFELSTNTATADWLYFFCGSPGVPGGPDASSDAVFVNFQVYDSWSGQSPGIGIHKNNKLQISKPITNWRNGGTWFPVVITYNKRAKDTWVVNFNGDDILKYSDSDISAFTNRARITGINTNGLIAYFDPGNVNSYPGYGSNMNSLVGTIRASLTGTYSYHGGNIRLTNTSSTVTSNVSCLQLNSSVSSIRTISMWYYQHSSQTGSTYLLDGRTGSGATFTSGFIYNGGVGANTWGTGATLYVDGGGSQTISWGNITRLGVWRNITVVSSSAFSDDLTLFGNYNRSECLDVTFGPIFVYNRSITQAENTANYNAVINSKVLTHWGIGATGFGASMNSYIRKLELSYNKSDYTSAGSIVRSGIVGNSAEVRLSNLYNKPRGLVDGLTYKVYYNGYWDTGAMTFFDNNVYSSIGRSSDFTLLRNATNGELFNGVGVDTVSVEWFGYFRANVTGTWTFSTASTDDAGIAWVGANALSNYTKANCIAYNGGTASGTISLVAGQYYPIRMWFGENTGLEEFPFRVTPPSGSALSNLTGYVFSSIGTNSDFPAESAKVIKAISGTNEDGMYYINCNGVSTATYCLMNDSYDGGGWMMMMKGTQGTTFNYESTHWTTTSTLNPTNANRDDGDAKYDTFNYIPIKDVLSVFPDVTTVPAFNVKLAQDSSYLSVYTNLDGTQFNGDNGRGFEIYLLRNNYNCWVNINNNLIQIYGLNSTVTGGSSAGGGTTKYLRLLAKSQTGSVVTSTTLRNSLQLVYPPTAMTANTTAISGQSYGNGTYIASASSEFAWQGTPSEVAYMAFGGGIWTDGDPSQYSSGNYIGSRVTNISGTNYSGEWLQIQLPSAIVLSHYNLFTRSNDLARGPRDFYIAGSTNGSTWVMLDQRTNQTGWTTSGFSYDITWSQPVAYQYYRIVVNKTNGGRLTIDEWDLFACDTPTNTVGELVSGSLSIPDGWSWKLDNWNGSTRTTALAGFQNSRDATPSNPTLFSGYDSRIWSRQYGSSRHIVGGGTHTGTDVKLRWGFIWNNESNLGSIDGFGGIGMQTTTWWGTIGYSAGDALSNSGLGQFGLNRRMRFELYGR